MDYEKLVKMFSDRKRQMMSLRDKKWTFTQIAKKYDITPQRVQQIINGTKAKHD